VTRSTNLSVARGLAFRTVTTLLKNPSLFVPPMLFPLMSFAAFAGGLSRLSHIPNFDYSAGYTSFQFVFVLLQSAAFAGVFTGFGIVRDFETGFARRLMVAAPDRRGILLGYGIGAIGRWAVTALVLTSVAMLAGMEVGGNGVDVFGLYTLAALVNMIGLLWSAGIAMRFRTLQAAPLMQLPVFLSLFFAPVFVPVELLAGWLQTIAHLNPVTLMLAAGRSLIAGQPVHIVSGFGAAFALIALFSVWALRGLRRAEAAGGG
jgi:ABC-2 type transport system permease protein